MIVLIGFMGAGKTTVGRLLAARLGRPFVDSDVRIEQRAGRDIAAIFARDGEAAFRDFEQKVVADVLAGPDAVVSLGGGACGRQATREVLARHTVVHLEVSYEEARRRVGAGVAGRGADRPMLARPDLPQLFAERRPLYDSIATVTVATQGRVAEAVMLDVVNRLRVDGVNVKAEDG